MKEHRPWTKFVKDEEPSSKTLRPERELQKCKQRLMSIETEAKNLKLRIKALKDKLGVRGD